MAQKGLGATEETGRKQVATRGTKIISFIGGIACWAAFLLASGFIIWHCLYDVPEPPGYAATEAAGYADGY